MAVPALPAPYAYVVEYRALDKCFPPSCALKSRDVFGLADEMQPDGDPGAYLQFGKHGGEFWELFFHRGRVVQAGESFSFELPESASGSELDLYLSAEEEKHAFSAKITFEELRTSAPALLLSAQDFAGITEYIDRPRKESEFAHENRAFTHVRIPIPSRDHRTMRVTIANVGKEGMGLGSPLVMKRVEGRWARQALWAIYDAVPYPLWKPLLAGPTGDPQTEWLPKYVAKNGTYFPNGLTPGTLTSSYSRRVFRAGFYNDVGEPMIARGFSEPVPEVTHNVIASLAEQGVQTLAFVGNFSVLPNYTYLGWDGGYDSEMAEHPYAVMTRYNEWVSEHPNDDAFVLWWIASTHLPWPDTREVKAPPPVPEGLPRGQLNPQIFPPTWANALAATDRLKEMIDAAHAANPNASRMLYLSADHGRGFTMRHEGRAFRSPITGAWPGGMSHGVGADAEEMRTPFALVFEGANMTPNEAPKVVTADTPIPSVMRAVETFFEAKLDLPDTRSFDSPVFSSAAAYESRWDDELIASVGVARTFRFIRGNWAYSEYTPKLDFAALWEKTSPIQLMLLGTPFRSGRFMAEELYDRARDPYERNNVAGINPDTVLDLRRQATDWLATYYDDATHGRYRYTFTFPSKVTVTLTAARAFDAWADGKPQTMRTPRSVELTGTRIEIQEKDDTVGVIELRGAFVEKPILLRCAENGLPVDATSPTRTRLNLALGRTNCPVPRAEHVSTMPDSVMFSFEPAHVAAGGSPNAMKGGQGGIINEQELMAGMKKWGYVRDIEKKP